MSSDTWELHDSHARDVKTRPRGQRGVLGEQPSSKREFEVLVECCDLISFSVSSTMASRCLIVAFPQVSYYWGSESENKLSASS